MTESDIEAALPRVAVGLKKYQWLQAQRDACDVRSNAEYRKRFNGFYRVRRGLDWQEHFFGLLEAKKGQTVPFTEVLEDLHRTTGRYEASFASKLLATIDPNMPVIDSVVLRNLNLRLPPSASKQRVARIGDIHSRLVISFNEFLRMEMGTASCPTLPLGVPRCEHHRDQDAGPRVVADKAHDRVAPYGSQASVSAPYRCQSGWTLGRQRDGCPLLPGDVPPTDLQFWWTRCRSPQWPSAFH